MGNEFSGIEDTEFVEMSQQTGYPEARVRKIYEQFKALDEENTGYISSKKLIEFCKLPKSDLTDFVLKGFKGANGGINFSRFIHVLSIFENGTQEDQLKCKILNFVNFSYF